MNRQHRKATAWIALVAMLLAALLPTLARASAAEGGSWLEICTTAGTPQRGEAPAAAALDHCPYCTLQGAGWAPPPAPLQATAPLAAARHAAQVPLAAPPALRPHSTAAPRGPPARA